MIIADWHDIENNVESEVHVNRFKSKEAGINKFPDTFKFLCADGSLSQEVTHKVKLYATKESRASTREEYLQFWVRRGVTLCKKTAELQTFLKLIVTSWKQGKICAVRVCVCIYRHNAQRTVVCTESVIIPKFLGKIH